MNQLRRRSVVLAIGVICGLGLLAVEQTACGGGGKAYTTPEEAPASYKVQGEYVGAAGDAELGCQVIALGDGAFQAVFYPGGLPGRGWDGKTRFTVDGKTEGEVTTFAPVDRDKKYLGKGLAFSALRDEKNRQAKYAATIKGGKMTGTTPEGVAFELTPVTYRSPTLGAEAPEGAKVLFDGTGTEAWAKGKMNDRKLLTVPAVSKEAFGDCLMHIEFMTPYMPKSRSQGRGNSGVYIQRRYEVQVLDSFGLAGMDNECGGVYKVARPKVNMCLPPLAWQTYDIEFKAPRWKDGKKVANAMLTVRHNGVVIHENLEVPHKTGGGQGEGPEPGPLYFQHHGNPVLYRNVWIVEK